MDGTKSGGGSSQPRLCGSPLYMSPEMIQTESSTFMSDIWALGATILEMASGKLPWSEKNFEGQPIEVALLNIGMSKVGPSLDGLRELGCSEALIGFLNKCFTINAEERPSAQELLQDPFMFTLGKTSAVKPPVPQPAHSGANPLVGKTDQLAQTSDGSSGSLSQAPRTAPATNAPARGMPSPDLVSPPHLNNTGRPSQLHEHLSFLRERSFDIRSQSQTPASTPGSLASVGAVPLGRATVLHQGGGGGGDAAVVPPKRVASKRLAVTSRRRVEVAGENGRLASGITAEFQDGMLLRNHSADDAEEENRRRCEGQKR
jgi:serine/threonine protein kinase